MTITSAFEGAKIITTRFLGRNNRVNSEFLSQLFQNGLSFNGKIKIWPLSPSAWGSPKQVYKFLDQKNHGRHFSPHSHQLSFPRPQQLEEPSPRQVKYNTRRNRFSSLSSNGSITKFAPFLFPTTTQCLHSFSPCAWPLE